MGHRRGYNIFIVVFLILGICASGMMVEVCFCGKACLSGFQDKSETKLISQFHKRCSGTYCKSCNLEKGRTLKAANTSTPIGNVKIFDTTCLIFVLVDYHPINHIAKGFRSCYVCGTVPSSPSYLQKLSFLC